jgi:hypothetical protein
MNDPGSSSQNPLPADPSMVTCAAMTSRGTQCQRLAKAGAKQCWQHSHGLGQKWRSLTRNQSILFVCALIGVMGVLITLLAWWYPQLWSKPRPPAMVGVPATPNIPRAKEAQPNPGNVTTGQKRAIHKAAKTIPPAVQVNNAPNGIAIGGGIVTNPTVNNYGLPSRRLAADERNNLKSAVSGTKARIIIWFFGGDDTQRLAQDLYEVFQEAGWEMAAAHPEGAIQAEPLRCDIGLFLPASSAHEPASAAAVAVVSAMKSPWMHLSVGTGLSDKVPEGSVKLVVGPRWEQ